MTTTSESSTMVAVFADREQANQAIDNLRRARYSYDRIRLVERGSNSFLESLKSMFMGQATATTNSADDWMRRGVLEQDAQTYQRELDAGRSIVLIKAVGRNPEQALSILRQSGAYEIAARMRTAVPTMGSGAYNPSGAPGTHNLNEIPGTQNTQSQQRPANTRQAKGVTIVSK